MRSELFDTRLCIQDFEKYDLVELEKTCEPFFWCVREHGTSLAHVGPSRMRKLMETQACRFAWFRDENAPLMGIMYWNDPAMKMFYWDGLSLMRVSKGEVQGIFMNIWEGEYEHLKKMYLDEYDIRNEPLEIRMSDSIKESYNHVLALADELKDASLRECVDRLSHYTRFAVDHYVEVYGDFAKNSFGFCEWMNGKQRLAGGIIYSDYRNENRWSIHT